MGGSGNSTQYKSNNNIVYSCKYHVIWCPKYRRSVLVNGVDKRLKKIIHEVAEENKSELTELTEEFPWLKSRLPTLWTNSYFVSTVGGASFAVIKQYVENQKNV